MDVCCTLTHKALVDLVPVQSTRKIRFAEDLFKARSSDTSKTERLAILGRLEGVSHTHHGAL